MSSFKDIAKALAKSGAKTVIAGLQAGGIVGSITGKILARTLGIDENDPELNDKIIEKSNTKEGAALIRQAELELKGRKAELFTELEVKKLEAQIMIVESENALDSTIYTESQKSYRTELGHSDPRVYLTRPWLVRNFFYLTCFIVSTVVVSMLMDWYEVVHILGDCRTGQCIMYLENRTPYYIKVSQAWNGITILKMLGTAVVTWFGSRGIEKAVSRYKSNDYTPT